jgi:hypothetical protein
VTALVGARRWRLAWPALLALLFLGAFALRLYHIDQPPFDFHAARQYRSLIIARGIYYDAVANVPAWQREVAEASRLRQGVLEPPLMESLAAAGYAIAGSEQTWIPRVLSSLFWLMGGAFLYRIGATLIDRRTALLALTFYLFLPFSVVASRSFQPDPAMVALILLSLWATLRHHLHPTPGRLAAAIACAALAMIWQPKAIPVVVAVVIVLAVQRRGPRNLAWLREAAALLGPAAVPAVIVYGSLALSGAFRTDIAQGIFRPDLWASPFLWRGWLLTIDQAVGWLPFFGGLLGLSLFPRGTPRALLLGLWFGYAAFGLAFDYSVAVDDYYHLQLVPIIALSAAPIVALSLERAEGIAPELPWRALRGVVVAAAVVLAVIVARVRTENPGWEHAVAIREAIGAAVGHSTHTIFLAGDYGGTLEYHGLLAGRPWPLQSDLEFEALTDRSPIDARSRFDRDFAAERPEYFIVLDLDQLAAQPDLMTFLDGGFEPLVETEDYRIYDLRLPRGT